MFWLSSFFDWFCFFSDQSTYYNNKSTTTRYSNTNTTTKTTSNEYNNNNDIFGLFFYYLDWGIWLCGICSDSFRPFCWQLSCKITYIFYSEPNTPCISLSIQILSFSFCFFSNQDIHHKHKNDLFCYTGDGWWIHHGFFYFSICKARF